MHRHPVLAGAREDPAVLLTAVAALRAAAAAPGKIARITETIHAEVGAAVWTKNISPTILAKSKRIGARPPDVAYLGVNKIIRKDDGVRLRVWLTPA